MNFSHRLRLMKVETIAENVIQTKKWRPETALFGREPMFEGLCMDIELLRNVETAKPVTSFHEKPNNTTPSNHIFPNNMKIKIRFNGVFGYEKFG